jgi:methionyl-tRNA formyltransferase
MTKIYIASSRDIGLKCIEWAKNNLPNGFEITENMEDCNIFISVLYDKIIKQDFIQNRKCFNFHPGILPEYRGAGCASWVIINGEKESGVTLHYIDSGIDTGDIINISKFPVNKNDTAYDVNEKALSTVFESFVDNFHYLLVGCIIATKQQVDEGKTYYRKDLDKAKDLTRFIKAFHFPGKEGAYYIKDNKKIYIGENYEKY